MQLGIGMSQEIDSDMVGRSLMWSHGGAMQDENENVTINSPETVAAVQFMKELFEGAMTEEVFAWNSVLEQPGDGRRQAFLHRQLDLGLPDDAEGQPRAGQRHPFVKALEGPGDALAAQHVMYNWIVPEHAENVDAAQEFLLHYTENYARATWESELYDFPAFGKLVPELDGWLDNDPYGSEPADKLSVLKDALDWSTNVGRHGHANTAIGEVFGTFIVPNMYARAARGEQTPEESVAQRRVADQADLREVAQAGPRRRRRPDPHGARCRGERAEEDATTATCAPWTEWTSRRARASTSCCSARRAAARPRCCARSPGWSSPPRARS